MLTYKNWTTHYIKEPLVFDLLGVLLAVNLHPHFTITLIIIDIILILPEFIKIGFKFIKCRITQHH